MKKIFFAFIVVLSIANVSIDLHEDRDLTFYLTKEALAGNPIVDMREMRNVIFEHYAHVFDVTDGFYTIEHWDCVDGGSLC